MATLEEQTNSLLEKFGGFIKSATGLDVYLLGHEFTRPAGQYIGLNIMSIDENAYSLANFYDANGFLTSAVNYNVRVTVTCFRSNAYTPLMKLKQRITSGSVLWNTYFTDKSIGYLSSTAVNRVDVPLDTITFEERAYMIFDFNMTAVETEDFTSTPVEQVVITSTAYDQTPLDTTPVVVTTNNTNPYI